MTLAESNSKKSAEKRREVHEKKSTLCEINIGTLALMKNHVQRRKKIQHVSKPKSYIDVGKLQDNVYKVISAKNGFT